MTYLVLKIVVYLLIAALIGGIIGWLLKTVVSRNSAAPAQAGSSKEHLNRIRELEEEREQTREQLKLAEQEMQTLKIRIAEIEYSNHGE